MFVCEEKKKIFKADGISEEEHVESDIIFIRRGLLAV